MVKKTALAAAAIGLLALPMSSSATVLIKKSIAEMAYESPLIISGDIVDAWADDSGGTISSFAVVDIEESFKGATTSPTVLVKMPGGQIGDLSVEVPSSPDLRVGDQVYLFLNNDYSGLTNVVGWAQGTFHVEDGVVVEANIPTRLFERRLEAVLEQLDN